MEENIKILEEIVETYRSCSVNEEGFDMKVDIGFMKKECEALENLIAGYKQLEEENKKFYEGEIFTAKQLKNIEQNQKKYFINKQVVIEKIEELDKRIDFLNTELTNCYIEREKLGTETDIDNNETYIFYMEEEKNFRKKQEEVLQELLREE